VVEVVDDFRKGDGSCSKDGSMEQSSFQCEGILSGIRGSRSNINSILPINRRLNRDTKLDTKAVPKALY